MCRCESEWIVEHGEHGLVRFILLIEWNDSRRFSICYQQMHMYTVLHNVLAQYSDSCQYNVICGDDVTNDNTCHSRRVLCPFRLLWRAGGLLYEEVESTRRGYERWKSIFFGRVDV